MKTWPRWSRTVTVWTRGAVLESASRFCKSKPWRGTLVFPNESAFAALCDDVAAALTDTGQWSLPLAMQWLSEQRLWETITAAGQVVADRYITAEDKYGYFSFADEVLATVRAALRDEITAFTGPQALQGYRLGLTAEEYRAVMSGSNGAVRLRGWAALGDVS